MSDAADSIPPCDDAGNKTDYTSRIAGLVMVGVVAMFLLHVLGSLRRRSSDSFLHFIVIATYTLSYALVSYTIGLMQSSWWYYEEFTVWAVCLLLLLGSTDNLTACRLSDIDNWKSMFVRHLFQGVWVVWILVQFGSDDTGYLGPLWAMLIVVLLKSHARITAMRTASKSYLESKDVKAIADYMHHEPDDPPARYNPTTMEGYRYVVTGEHRQKYVVKRPEYMLRYKKDNMTITTVEHIWGCAGRLLRHERRKDICLSMALAKMLNRRFAGFELAEAGAAGLPKTHAFVFGGLLAGDMPHERTFRVIEEELAFVHDLYYTRYPYLYQSGRLFSLYLPTIMLGLCSWLIYIIFGNYKKAVYYKYITAFTIVIMAMVTFLEAFQLYLYLASGWFKVSLIRRYVTTPLLQRSGFLSHMIMGFLLRLKALGAWEEKLGQYSFLSSFTRRHRITNCLHYLTMRLVDKGKEGRKKKKLVKLSVQVKKAIVASLLESKGDLTNGVRTLRNNGVDGDGHLSWACKGSSATRTILIWHIATTLCKHELDEQTKRSTKKIWWLPAMLSAVHTASSDQVTLSEEDTRAVSVASILSHYCAYLVAFAPNFLPDHSSVSSFILGESINEAREALEGAKSMEDKWQKLKRKLAEESHGDDASIVVLGARLAKYLMEDIREPTLRWKILSGFWAEMILYMAPSNDALAHLEALARGGEFITHLWALLTHAGLLKQPIITRSPGDV